MKKKIITMACAIMLLSGCGKIPTLENGEQIIAELDGRNITVTELYESLKEKYGADSLINMIDEWIANQEYATTDEILKYVDEQFESAKKYYESYYGTDFETILKENGIESEKAYKEYILLGYKQNLIIEDYAKTLVDEKDIKKYYDENVYGKINASHILISPKVTDDMNDDEKTNAEKEAYDKAVSIINKLNNGEDFATLAKENSDDTVSAVNGGKLDAFDNNSGFVEEFFDAAVKLENGKYSKEPVKSTFGYHIIYKESTEEKPSYDDKKEEIVKLLANDIINTDTTNSISYKALINIREKYNLNIVDSDIDSIYKDSIKDIK